jgi:hypothetical protein
MIEVLHHLLSNDHNEWGMIIALVSDQLPVIQAYAGRVRCLIAR